MENKKKRYLAPTLEVKAVEIESSICGGSTDIKAAAPATTTQAQEVNTSFNEIDNSGTWDNITSTTE